MASGFFGMYLNVLGRNKRSWKGTYHREPFLVDLTCQLEMNTAQYSPHLPMNLHGPCNLMDDIDEMSSLECRVRFG